MSLKIPIGVYHEREPREIIHNHTYYAADWRKLRTIPGDYPVTLGFDSGNAHWFHEGMRGLAIPVMHELSWAIDADVIDGKTYSGFGGLNFASTPVRQERTRYHVRPYLYDLHYYIDEGTVTLAPEFEWLVNWKHDYYPKWAEIKDTEGAYV